MVGLGGRVGEGACRGPDVLAAAKSSAPLGANTMTNTSRRGVRVEGETRNIWPVQQSTARTGVRQEGEERWGMEARVRRGGISGRRSGGGVLKCKGKSGTRRAWLGGGKGNTATPRVPTSRMAAGVAQTLLSAFPPSSYLPLPSSRPALRLCAWFVPFASVSSRRIRQATSALATFCISFKQRSAEGGSVQGR